MHIPVLQKEVLKYLDPKPNENFIDATMGEAGHSLAVLEKTGPKGKILGIEQDPEMAKNLEDKIRKPEIRERVIIARDNFVNLKEIVKKEKFQKISGILFDLGMSSWHLEESKRGFTFQKKEPLDMRYDTQAPLTAEKIINYWSVQDIEKVLREYGEEQFAKEISEKIVEARRMKEITNTLQLAEVIKIAVPGWYRHQRIHPATKTFQALRIAVNGELDVLKKVLPQTLELLAKEGRLAIISFHSLEDRIVKDFFNEKSEKGILKILTKKPIVPSQEEIKSNPRSRSAKLRCAQI